MSSQPGTPNPQVQQARQMFNSLSQGRKIVIIAAIVGLVDSFLHWYSYGSSPYTYAANGWTDWGLFAVLGFVVAGVLIVMPFAGLSLRKLAPTLPPTVTEPRAVMGAGAVALVATIIYMLTMGFSSPGLSQGPTYGSYIGLICAIAIIVGGFLMQNEPSTI